MLAAEPATAQSVPETRDAGGSQIAEVIVTAQRRNESSQNIPLSLNVLRVDDAIAMGLTDTLDLAGSVPTLTISNAGSKFYFLRGVGTTGANINQEQSVATYLDGVYLFSSWASVVPLSNQDRVEILKGPQGTLFGRNTTGGVIQLVTKDPTKGNAFDANVGYGNYQTFTAQAYAALKASERFAVGLAVDYQDQGEGWGRNIVRNEEAYLYDHQAFQAKAVFEPIDGTKITGMFWYNETESTGFQTQVVPGVVGLDGTVSRPKRYEIRSDSPNTEDSEAYFGYLRLDQQIGFADLVSLTSYREVDDVFNLDQDSVPVPVVNANLVQPTHAFSQEFQLVSPADSRLKWMVGAFYFESEAGYEPITIAGAAATPFPQIEIYNRQHTQSLAGFGQLTWPLADATNVTAGYRYTSERAREKGHRLFSQGVQILTNPEQTVDSNGPTWRLALDHKFTDDLMGYVSYNRGLKSGGFDLVSPTNQTPYRPERLDAYEVGIKSDLAGGRLRLNLAAFLYEFEDIQVQRIIAGGTATINAAQAEMRGLDAEITAALTDGLTLTATLGYLDGEYEDFPNAVGYPASGLAGPSFEFDASGNTTVYSPEVSGSLGLTYTIPSSIGEFTAVGLVQHISDQFVSAENRLEIPAYTLVNASLSWASNAGYSVSLWAKNLLDEEYINNALVGGVSDLQAPGAPRTYGISFGWKY